MTSAIATMLVVFGRGVTYTGDCYTLTPGGATRVQAVLDYVTAHRAAFVDAARQGRSPRVVFSGGWAEACDGAPKPPVGSREGDLMLRQARAAGLDRYAQLHAETRSRSTLENLLHTAGDGLLAGQSFSDRQPLGIVSHRWHLPRIRFLAGKVLGLRGPALLDVPANDVAASGRSRSEPALHLACRLYFLGARDPAELVRRERRIIASVRRAERLTGRPAAR